MKYKFPASYTQRNEQTAAYMILISEEAATNVHQRCSPNIGLVLLNIE
jgi:hypothetical protein